jgi:competence protein ComEC
MWNDKPALVAALIICSGILLARETSIHFFAFGFAVVPFIVASIIAIVRQKKPALNGITSFIIAITLLLASAADFSSLEIRSSHHITAFCNTSQPLKIRAAIVNDPQVKNGRTTAVLRIISVASDDDSATVEGDALLSITPDKHNPDSLKAFHYGNLIEFSGTLETPSSSRNPGEFSERDYLDLNNIYATVHVFGCKKITILSEGNPNPFLEYVIFPSKHFVVRTIKSCIGGEEAGFLIGMLLGDRADISPEMKNAFVDTGTVYVLAVAGVHVAMIAVVIYALFGLLRLPEKTKIIATMAGIVYYMELAGATPSASRASLMAIIVLAAKLFQYKPNPFNTLGASAVILLALDPKQLFDAGFELSYSAAFSMIYFYPKLSALIKKIPERWEEIRGVSFVLDLFALSLAAQIGTIPFTAYYFEKISLVSLVANIVIVPVMEVTIPLGFVIVVLSAFSLWIGSFFAESARLILWFALKFISRTAAVPHASLPTPGFGIRESFFYFLTLTGLFNIANAKIFRRTILIAIAGFDVFFLASIFSPEGSSSHILHITFLDVGQGDAALIECPSGEKILVDAGPRTLTYDAGEKVIGPFLRRRGISCLDAIVVTHPHSDHLGGVPYLMKNFEVKKVIDPGQKAQSSLYYEYALLTQKVRSSVSSGSMLFNIPNMRFYTLHPVESFLDLDSTDGYTQLNNTSIVFKLLYGSTSFLFAGDAERPVEERLDSVFGNFLRSDILKVGHHGSITSSTEEFLENVKPEEAVISVGKFNKFHHPSVVVIHRLQALGVRVHRTDEEGAIVFESDGTKITYVNWQK